MIEHETTTTATTENATMPGTMPQAPAAPADPAAATVYRAYLAGMKAGVSIVVAALQNALAEAGTMQAAMIENAFNLVAGEMNKAAATMKSELESHAGTDADAGPADEGGNLEHATAGEDAQGTEPQATPGTAGKTEPAIDAEPGTTAAADAGNDAGNKAGTAEKE